MMVPGRKKGVSQTRFTPMGFFARSSTPRRGNNRFSLGFGFGLYGSVSTVVDRPRNRYTAKYFASG